MDKHPSSHLSTLSKKSKMKGSTSSSRQSFAAATLFPSTAPASSNTLKSGITSSPSPSPTVENNTPIPSSTLSLKEKKEGKTSSGHPSSTATTLFPPTAPLSSIHVSADVASTMMQPKKRPQEKFNSFGPAVVDSVALRKSMVKSSSYKSPIKVGSASIHGAPETVSGSHASFLLEGETESENGSYNRKSRKSRSESSVANRSNNALFETHAPESGSSSSRSAVSRPKSQKSRSSSRSEVSRAESDESKTKSKHVSSSSSKKSRATTSLSPRSQV